MSTRHTILASPIGDLTVVRDDAGLPVSTSRTTGPGPNRPPSARGSTAASRTWPASSRSTSPASGGSSDLPLHAGRRRVQHRVWDLLAAIPYGSTVTYGELARALGDGTTAQEVGAAVGRNPLSILVGCHRVVGGNGKLTGYAGGLARKRRLLDLESGSRAGGVLSPTGKRAVRAGRGRARADRAAGLPRRARSGRRRRRLVGDVPGRAAGLPATAGRTPTSRPGW